MVLFCKCLFLCAAVDFVAGSLGYFFPGESDFVFAGILMDLSVVFWPVYIFSGVLPPLRLSHALLFPFLALSPALLFLRILCKPGRTPLLCLSKLFFCAVHIGYDFSERFVYTFRISLVIFLQGSVLTCARFLVTESLFGKVPVL